MRMIFLYFLFVTIYKLKEPTKNFVGSFNFYTAFTVFN